jgi:hypothetical protein
VYGIATIKTMKTTVDIPDALFQQAKAVAAERGVPFRELVESGLRLIVKGARPKKRFKLRDCSFHGDGLAPGITWEEIREKAYEGRSG